MRVLRSSRTGDQCLELAERELWRQVLHAAVRRGDEPLRRNYGEGLPDSARDEVCRLDLARAEDEYAEDDCLVLEVGQHLRVEVRLRGLERDVRRGAVVQLTQERVARRLVLDDGRVAEAGVEDGLALDAGERAVDRLDSVLPRPLRARLEVRLVDLHNVRAGRLEIAEFLVDGFGVREREAPPVAVVVVLRLLRHRERAGNRDLDPAIGDRAEELDVAALDRPRPSDLADDPRDWVLVAGAVERNAGMVEVYAVEGRREAVGVALSPHFPVRDHVDPRPLHVLHGKPRRVVLRLL